MEILRQLRFFATMHVAFAHVAFTFLALPVMADDHPNEYQVKAAFLYNFLKFVDWPALPEGQPWVIGVVGSGDFAAILSDTVQGKAIDGHPVIVKRLASLAEARGCHIAFSPAPPPAPMPPLPGVLTVGAGGIVNFYMVDDKVRFEIKPLAAKAAGLHISAQLLKLGTSH